jgi:DNA (cytosine-5)-methyltransferase 1
MSGKLKVVDLFCGAGGLHIGFERSGFQTQLCIDNNLQVEKTHKLNFPNIPFINRDIALISSEEIATYIDGELDVMAGGPPCQGFSTIGKRSSSDPEKRSAHDPRNELVITYAKLISDLKPKFIVMENVKGILTMDKGAYLNNVLNLLRNAGYNVDYKLINMADYGVPQIRQRVIILGNRLGLPVSFPEPTHAENPDFLTTKWNNCWDVIKDLADLPETPEFNHVALKHTDKNIERYKLIPEGGRLPEDKLSEELYRKNFGNTYKRLHREKPSLTMVPGNDAFPIHPILNRSLTIREAARIQTFPDEMIFAGNRRQQGHQAGNAVPPKFSEILAEFIKNELLKVK